MGTAEPWPTVLLVYLRMREMAVETVQLGVDWLVEKENGEDVAIDVLG